MPQVYVFRGRRPASPKLCAANSPKKAGLCAPVLTSGPMTICTSPFKLLLFCFQSNTRRSRQFFGYSQPVSLAHTINTHPHTDFCFHVRTRIQRTKPNHRRRRFNSVRSFPFRRSATSLVSDPSRPLFPLLLLHLLLLHHRLRPPPHHLPLPMGTPCGGGAPRARWSCSNARGISAFAARCVRCYFVRIPQIILSTIALRLCGFTSTCHCAFLFANSMPFCHRTCLICFCCEFHIILFTAVVFPSFLSKSAHSISHSRCYFCFLDDCLVSLPPFSQHADPPLNPYFTPHSCGEPCLKSRSGDGNDNGSSGGSVSECPHLCNIPCHPGPCPPCAVVLPPRACACGAKSLTLRCGVSASSSSSSDSPSSSSLFEVRAMKHHFSSGRKQKFGVEFQILVFYCISRKHGHNLLFCLFLIWHRRDSSLLL